MAINKNTYKVQTSTRELRILTWLCSGTTARARSSSRLYSLEVGNRIVKLNFKIKQHTPTNETGIQLILEPRQLVDSLNTECNKIIEKSSLGSSNECQTAPHGCRPSDWVKTWVMSLRVANGYHLHLQLSLHISQPEHWYSPNHFTAERWVDPCTAVIVCSPYPRLYIALVFVMKTQTAHHIIQSWDQMHTSHMLAFVHCHTTVDNSIVPINTWFLLLLLIYSIINT